YVGGHRRCPAAGDCLRGRYRDAPSAGSVDRGRADRQPGVDSIHHSGCLSVCPSLGPQEQVQADPAAGGEYLMRFISILGVTIACALVTACVGPNYKRPTFDATAAYKEQDGWKPSEPSDALDRGNWWEIFHDEVLNSLEAQLNISNENLKATAAAVEESRALLRQAQAQYWPSVGVSAQRQRTVQGTGKPRTLNSFDITGTWDVDLWGRIRRTTESSRASLQASEADLASARLAAQAELATDYFELRVQDQLQIILNDIVAAEQQSLKITENRYRVGVAAKADVVTAQTQLLTSQAQQVNAPLQRALLEHSIAVLVGQQPANFSIASTAMRAD